MFDVPSGYKSPIDIFPGEIQTSVEKQMEDNVYRAVRDVGIDVDKYELIKALAYDRGQYDKGYADGRRAAMSEIVRCRDCKYYKEGELLAPEKFCFRLMHPTENRHIGYNFTDDDFCSYGERKDNGV